MNAIKSALLGGSVHKHGYKNAADDLILSFFKQREPK
jgi:hypothetical protein